MTLRCIQKLTLAAVLVGALLIGCARQVEEPPPADEPAAETPAGDRQTPAPEPEPAAVPESDPAPVEPSPPKPEPAPEKPKVAPAETGKSADKPTAGSTPVKQLLAKPPAAPKPNAGKPEVATPPPAKPSGPAPLVVVGVVTKASHVPEPGTVPYTECLTYVKYKVLMVKSGEYPKGELLAVHWGMRDNKLMPAAKLKLGQKLTLRLEPFDKHPELQRAMAADDTEEYGLTAYWVAEIE